MITILFQKEHLHYITLHLDTIYCTKWLPSLTEIRSRRRYSVYRELHRQAEGSVCLYKAQQIRPSYRRSSNCRPSLAVRIYREKTHYYLSLLSPSLETFRRTTLSTLGIIFRREVVISYLRRSHQNSDKSPLRIGLPSWLSWSPASGP